MSFRTTSLALLTALVSLPLVSTGLSRTTETVDSFLTTTFQSPITTFTPPSSCLDTTYTLPPAGYDSYGYDPGLGWSAARGLDPACYPASFYLLDQPATYQSYIFPGQCPSGYAAVEQFTSADTTYATCCPSSYIVHTANCTLQAPKTIALANGSSVFPATVQAMVASSIVVAWQTPDLTVSNTTTPAPSTGSSSSNGGSSLSTSAEVGIGIGSAVAGIAICTLIFVCWKRLRRAQQGQRRVPPSPQEDIVVKAELSGEGKAVPEMPMESTVYEAPEKSPVEADVGIVERAELESDWAGWEAPVSPCVQR